MKRNKRNSGAGCPPEDKASDSTIYVAIGRVQESISNISDMLKKVDQHQENTTSAIKDLDRKYDSRVRGVERFQWRLLGGIGVALAIIMPIIGVYIRRL